MDTDWEMYMGYGNDARIGNGQGNVKERKEENYKF